MGCIPMGSMIYRAVKRLRGKVKRKKAFKGYDPRSEERMARSVSQGNDNPIYVTHPPAEITTTWAPPQSVPDMAIVPSTHVFPDTSETKQVVQVRYAETDNYDRYPAPYAFGRNDTEHLQHESELAGYSYNSPTRGPAYEDNGKREYLSGEYHYYPTPVRDGIYNITTDGSRLATIFSDENPNACNIV